MSGLEYTYIWAYIQMNKGFIKFDAPPIVYRKNVCFRNVTPESSQRGGGGLFLSQILFDVVRNMCQSICVI